MLSNGRYIWAETLTTSTMIKKLNKIDLYNKRQTSWLWFLVAILLFIGIFTVFSMLLMSFVSFIGVDNEILQVFIFLTAIALMHPSLYISHKIVYKLGYKRLFFDKIFINIAEIKRVILFICATAILSEMFLWVYLDEMPTIARVASWDLWLAILLPMFLLIFLQTSAEEIVFRGFFQVHLKQLIQNKWVYIIIPSLIWAFLHIDNFSRGGFSYMVVFSIFILGIIFADWRDLTGSIAAPMILHFYNNFMVFMILGMDIEPFPTHLWRSAFINYETHQQIIIVFAQTLISAIVYLLIRHFAFNQWKKNAVKNG